jgi:putative ATP-dependent endonuclease of the OLD family
LVLGTSDQEWQRLDDVDFHRRVGSSGEIKITCKFEGLSSLDKRAFVEHLTYRDASATDPCFYLNWTAKNPGGMQKGKYRRIEVGSGKNGDGPNLAPETRELLRATYLRPLRDAEDALSSGRGSRLSQVLQYTDSIKSSGVGYDPGVDMSSSDLKSLNVLGIGDLANALLAQQQGIVDTRNKIDAHLRDLSIRGNNLKSNIKVSGATASEEARLRQLLEKLDLVIGGDGKPGLGSNNLLFMACELLLIGKDDEGSKLLLIEEPEVHLHAQRQLRVMKTLIDACRGNGPETYGEQPDHKNESTEEEHKDSGFQVIVTTHSPNLASAIRLNDVVLIRNGRAFSMAQGETQLETADYRFLERFLDVTKANLFFARGVIIVEGDAENILLPTLAAIPKRNFTEHGVSIVNVGGLGLHRYGRIFQRKDPTAGQLDIPVACITDLDVMPNCAPAIIGKLHEGESWPAPGKRRWRAKRDFADSNALELYRNERIAKATGQCVKTFVSDEWTFEYDLALGRKNEDGSFSGGLSEDVFVSSLLADEDDAISSGKKTYADVEASALEQFVTLKSSATARDQCKAEEVIAAIVYAQFAKHDVSKAIAAQYLAERLQAKHAKGQLAPEELRKRLPQYLMKAIDYVTGMEVSVISAQAASNR